MQSIRNQWRKFVRKFLPKTYAGFAQFLNAQIYAYNHGAPIGEMVTPLSPVRFTVGINEDLEAYSLLIAHSMREIIRNGFDGISERVEAERAKIKAIVDEHGERLREYLKPYRGLTTEQVGISDNHRVFAATYLFGDNA